jgi:hypothetical protein
VKEFHKSLASRIAAAPSTQAFMTDSLAGIYRA